MSIAEYISSHFITNFILFLFSQVPLLYNLWLLITKTKSVCVPSHRMCLKSNQILFGHSIWLCATIALISCKQETTVNQMTCIGISVYIFFYFCSMQCTILYQRHQKLGMKDLCSQYLNFSKSNELQRYCPLQRGLCSPQMDIKKIFCNILKKMY